MHFCFNQYFLYTPWFIPVLLVSRGEKKKKKSQHTETAKYPNSNISFSILQCALTFAVKLF